MVSKTSLSVQFPNLFMRGRIYCVFSTFFILFIIASSSFASSVPVQLNGRRVSYETLTIDGIPALHLAYEPYDSKLHEQWAQLRASKNGQDPLGSRDYWQPSSDQLTGKFDITLKLTDTTQWVALDNEIDADVLSLVYPSIASFVAQNKRTLQSLSESILSDLVSKGLKLQQPSPPTFDYSLITPENVAEVQNYLALWDYLNPEIATTLKYQLGQAELYAESLSNLTNRTRILKLPVAPVLPEKPILIVTHGSQKWDTDSTAKAGIDEVIAGFKKLSNSVVYLMDDDGMNDKQWYAQDRKPTYAIYSSAGENDVPISTPDVTIVGGYIGRCQTIATEDVVSRYFLKHSDVLRIHFPLKAIYVQDDASRETTLNLLNVKNTIDRLQVSSKSAAIAYTQKHFESATGRLTDWADDSVFAGLAITRLFTDKDGGFSGPAFQLSQGDIITGTVDFDHFQFQLFIDGKVQKILGTGPHVVQLLFE
jgi:hypothetical protein